MREIDTKSPNGTLIFYNGRLLSIFIGPSSVIINEYSFAMLYSYEPGWIELRLNPGSTDTSIEDMYVV